MTGLHLATAAAASHHLPLNGGQALGVSLPEALSCGRLQINQEASILASVAGAAAIAVVVSARVQHLALQLFRVGQFDIWRQGILDSKRTPCSAIRLVRPRLDVIPRSNQPAVLARRASLSLASTSIVLPVVGFFSRRVLPFHRSLHS